VVLFTSPPLFLNGGFPYFFFPVTLKGFDYPRSHEPRSFFFFFFSFFFPPLRVLVAVHSPWAPSTPPFVLGRPTPPCRTAAHWTFCPVNPYTPAFTPLFTSHRLDLSTGFSPFFFEFGSFSSFLVVPCFSVYLGAHPWSKQISTPSLPTFFLVTSFPFPKLVHPSIGDKPPRSIPATRTILLPFPPIRLGASPPFFLFVEGPCFQLVGWSKTGVGVWVGPLFRYDLPDFFFLYVRVGNVFSFFFFAPCRSGPCSLRGRCCATVLVGQCFPLPFLFSYGFFFHPPDSFPGSHIGSKIIRNLINVASGEGTFLFTFPEKQPPFFEDIPFPLRQR